VNAQTGTNGDVMQWAKQPVTVGDSGLEDLIVRLQAGITVSGRVEFQGAAGSPLADGGRMTVGLRPIGAGSWRTAAGTVGSDGTFSTRGDPGGRYTVFSSPPPGWTLDSVSLDGKVLPDDVLELTAGDVTGLLVTYLPVPTILSGSVADAIGAPDASADVVVFGVDSTLWREGYFLTRQTRMVHATSAGAFEISGLAPGEYYVAAVSTHLVPEWRSTAFLERLIPGATRVTLGPGRTTTVSLAAITPRDR
jgi:hypothetical protein